MNQDHTAIPCTLADFYAGDWVDKLDEAKTNIDERMAIAQGGAWALGRKTDDQIITALGTTTQTASNWTVTSQAAIRNSAINMVRRCSPTTCRTMVRSSVFSPAKAWAFLMTVDEFKRSDYLGTQSNGLPYVEGAPVMRFKNWMGVNWGLHTGVVRCGHLYLPRCLCTTSRLRAMRPAPSRATSRRPTAVLRWRPTSPGMVIVRRTSSTT
jgi:hypothetical protein